MVAMERVPIASINPAPYNPRKDLRPGDGEYQRLQRSIAEFGCVEPLVWNKRTGTLVGGHQRFKILLASGATEVDVSVVDLPPAKEKALNIALNKVQGDWDRDKLAALLDELKREPELELSSTGFESREADDLIAEFLRPDGSGEDEFDVDAALASAANPITQPGDVIELGADPASCHRLMCGDATNPAHVVALMQGQRASLFATDPPYLVGYDGTNHPPKQRRAPGKAKPKGNAGGGSGGNKDWSGTYGVTWDDADANIDLYDRFVRIAVDEAVRPDAAWYCWYASKRQALVERAWASVGVLPHCQIVWVKRHGVLTRTWYSWAHEPCLMGWLKGNKPRRVDPQVLSTVWEVPTIPNGAHRPDHPTPKAIELFEIPMRQHTERGDICYEPFAGSGTQIIAAQRLGRRCFAMEISPAYCDVVVRRVIAFAGKQAVSRAVARRYAAPIRKGGAA
jgi:DNA modification methylase